MKKYKLLKVSLFATILSLMNPSLSNASDKKMSDRAKDWGERIITWSEKGEEFLNDEVIDPVKEIAESISIYKHDSLWLITDIPSVNPEDERHYYFINKNTPHVKWTYYYDQFGKRVKSNSEDIVKIEVRTMYISLNDPDVVFRIEEWSNRQTNSYTINFIDLNKETIYDPDTECKYGRFTNVEDIIPECLIKEKYDTKELQNILDVINNVDYVIKKEEDLSLTRRY